KRVKRIVFFLADGVELVIVALRAAGGESKPGSRDRIGPIDDLLETSLVAVHAALAIGEGVAQKTRRNPIVDGSVRQQIPGDLPNGETIKRLIPVESFNQPLAI